MAREPREAVLAAKVGNNYLRDGECCSQLHVSIYFCSVRPPSSLSHDMMSQGFI